MMMMMMMMMMILGIHLIMILFFNNSIHHFMLVTFMKKVIIIVQDKIGITLTKIMEIKRKDLHGLNQIRRNNIQPSIFQNPLQYSR